MSLQLPELESLLEQSPEDWSLRIRLIETRVRQGDMDGARQLIRESPDDAPLPYELQHRVHTLMTQGAAAFANDVPETMTEEGLASPNEVTALEASREVLQTEAVEKKTPVDPAESVQSKLAAKEERTTVDSPHHEPAPLPSESPMATPGKQKDAAPLDLNALREQESHRWNDYEGDLRLEPMTAVSRRERQAMAAQKVSAFSFALLVHFVFVVLVGFIVVSVPRPKPPQLIATVTETKSSLDIVRPRITRAKEQKPAAASAAAPNVIGAIGASPVMIPEMETTNAVDVTSMVTGNAAIGEGISFAGDAREMSDVNFFGISAGGKRIVLIIDATREMLVDEKGGMYAYDKVKNEIGVMLAGLNRGTKFNLLLYEGNRLMAFAEEPVVAMPSNLRLAVEWLSPLNRTYEQLGLAGHRGQPLEVAGDIEPIAARDVAHYTKAIQKAIEWQASTVFCISAGYRRINQSPSPEDMERYLKERAANPGTPGTVSASERAAWNNAVQKTRTWLQKENAARRAKDLPPKVVTNFNQLVQQITGATQPRASGGTPGARRPQMEPHTPDDIETLVKNGVKLHYGEIGLDKPSVHMVVFLGEDEDMNDQTSDHFKNLTRRNNGKFKMLRGLSALQNVTGRD